MLRQQYYSTSVHTIAIRIDGLNIFFFKQKTAYEFEYGLVGSEMFISDRGVASAGFHPGRARRTPATDRLVFWLPGGGPGVGRTGGA